MDGGADRSERYEFLACADQNEVATGWDKLMTLRFSTTYKWLTADGRRGVGPLTDVAVPV